MSAVTPTLTAHLSIPSSCIWHYTLLSLHREKSMCKQLDSSLEYSLLLGFCLGYHCHFLVALLRLYFYTTAQIAQVSQPMPFKWSGQLGQSGEQERNTQPEVINKGKWSTLAWSQVRHAINFAIHKLHRNSAKMYRYTSHLQIVIHWRVRYACNYVLWKES